MTRQNHQVLNSLKGGNKQGKSAPPCTQIRFVVGDQTNIESPTSPPMLDDYIFGIAATLEFTFKDGRVNTLQGINMRLVDQRYEISGNLSVSANPAVPVDVTEIQITLVQTRRNGLDPNLAVNIIAQNKAPIFPTSTITVQARDWQQNKSTDQNGNLIYTVNLNLLAPAILFNFRQDYWSTKLEGEDLAAYQILKSYFKEETPSSTVRTQPLTHQELDFYETMGNNVTIFIHGYNVGFGDWPIGIQQTLMEMGIKIIPGLQAGGPAVSLWRDDDYFKAGYPDVDLDPSEFVTPDQRYGTDAHKWVLGMEHSLSKAAGFDGKDYSKYERIIGISWQGNPNSALDYSVANAMPYFAAKKIFALVQQLHARGIKINIMAHSLGNAVLMNVLEHCGKAGIQLDHAFLWEAAIPNTAFDATPKQYMPLAMVTPIIQTKNLM